MIKYVYQPRSLKNERILVSVPVIAPVETVSFDYCKTLSGVLEMTLTLIEKYGPDAEIKIDPESFQEHWSVFQNRPETDHEMKSRIKQETAAQQLEERIEASKWKGLKPTAAEVSKKPVHRTDGYGNQYWEVKGKLHREDGPAYIGTDGYTEWYQNGKLHREGGPVICRLNGREEWYINGVYHRTDGPAFISKDGQHSWYILGNNITGRVKQWMASKNISWPWDESTGAVFEKKFVVES